MTNLRLMSLSLAFGVSLAILPYSARAECGIGIAPSYDDVEAVLFVHPGFLRKPLTRFDWSEYWATFTKYAELNQYSQDTLQGQIGTYRLRVTLAKARKILARHDFYNLVSGNQSVTDIRPMTLSVVHCGIVTKLVMYPVKRLNESVYSLFNDFESLIAASRKQKMSSRATSFVPYEFFDEIPSPPR